MSGLLTPSIPQHLLWSHLDSYLASPWLCPRFSFLLRKRDEHGTPLIWW